VSRPPPPIVPFILPGPYIEGLSDKKFSDVGALLLAHPSVLTQPGIAFCYCGLELFPTELFINPGIVGPEHWIPLRRMLIQAGYHLLIQDKPCVAASLSAMDLIDLWLNQAAAWSMITNELWGPALRLKQILEGAPEIEITARTLKELRPYFTPSTRMAKFMSGIVRVDYSNAVTVAQEVMTRIIQPVTLPFPRIKKLGETMKEVLL